jgi:hypothetical protein
MAQRRRREGQGRDGPGRLAFAAQDRRALVAQTLEERLAKRQVGLVPERLEAGLAAVVLQAGGAVGLARRLDENCSCQHDTIGLWKVFTLRVLDVGRHAVSEQVRVASIAGWAGAMGAFTRAMLLAGARPLYTTCSVCCLKVPASWCGVALGSEMEARAIDVESRLPSSRAR